jgi:hypothetical protein
MERRGRDPLAQFCIAQYEAFAPEAWRERIANQGNRSDSDFPDAEVVALAAKYLSMTSWYGHEEELAQVAACIRPGQDGCAGIGLEHEFYADGFDLPHFAMAVRAGLARSHPGHNRRRGVSRG